VQSCTISSHNLRPVNQQHFHVLASKGEFRALITAEDATTDLCCNSAGRKTQLWNHVHIIFQDKRKRWRDAPDPMLTAGLISANGGNLKGLIYAIRDYSM
jgi:hypothetical protein